MNCVKRRLRKLVESLGLKSKEEKRKCHNSREKKKTLCKRKKKILNDSALINHKDINTLYLYQIMSFTETMKGEKYSCV